MTSMRLMWDSNFTSLVWNGAADLAIGLNPWRVILMDRPFPRALVPRTMLGPIHRCGGQAYYRQHWDGQPQQCAPCHSRQVAAHQREQRFQWRLRRLKLRLQRENVND